MPLCIPSIKKYSEFKISGYRRATWCVLKGLIWMTSPGGGEQSRPWLPVRYMLLCLQLFFTAPYNCIYLVVHYSVAEAVPVYDQSHSQSVASVPAVSVCLYILIWPSAVMMLVFLPVVITGRYKPYTGCTSHIVNHGSAPNTQNWLTDMMLNENPLFLT